MADRTAEQVSGLKAHLGYWMRMVSNSVSQQFARKLADSGVTVAEWVILREMFSREARIAPSAVAEFAGLSRGAVSKLIDRLLAKELVTRFESSEDRRFQEIVLTRKATKLVPTLAKLADENDSEFFSALTSSERKDLAKLLMKLADFHELKTNPIK